MLRKPKTIEGIAGHWANLAKKPEQETSLSEAITNALRSYKWAREILKNELAPNEAKEDLKHLSTVLRRAKAALGRTEYVNSAVNALLAQEHWKYRPLYEGCTTREEANERWLHANKQWPEIEKRFWNDIDAISRLCELAAQYKQRMSLAQGRDQNPIGQQKKTASRKNKQQPWMVVLGADAESMWREVLGHAQLGKPFLNFYNDICDLVGEKSCISIEALDKRKLVWRSWKADADNGRVAAIGNFPTQKRSKRSPSTP
jgi:hypothetical protein